MTTPATLATGTHTWPAWAAATAGISAVLTAIGTFWSPLANYEATQTKDDFYSWLIVVGVIGVGLAIAFGVVVRTASPQRADRRGLVLALVSLPLVAVFWTGLPVIFAGAGACLALSNGRPSTVGKITLAIGVVVLGVAVFAALAG